MTRPCLREQLAVSRVLQQPVQRMMLFDLSVLMTQTLPERAREVVTGAQRIPERAAGRAFGVLEETRGKDT